MAKEQNRVSAAERVGRNVNRIRKSKDLTLAQLSKLTHDLDMPISLSVLSKIERGDRQVHVDDLEVLAEALEVGTFQLLARSEDPTDAQAEAMNRIATLIDRMDEITKLRDEAERHRLDCEAQMDLIEAEMREFGRVMVREHEASPRFLNAVFDGMPGDAIRFLKGPEAEATK